MALQKALPEIINDFKVIEDLGNTGKRRYLIAICKYCNKHFKSELQLIKRLKSCSRECSNNQWLLNLKKHSGFKIISLGELIKNKRQVIAECPHCLNHFRSTLQALKNTTQCGCLDYAIGYPKRLMRIKKNMIERCYNPTNINYSRYGARGIKICNEWIAKTSDFFKWALANGYQDNLSIDRINNNGNYEPSNCRWATRQEQMRNTRRSDVR